MYREKCWQMSTAPLTHPVEAANPVRAISPSASFFCCLDAHTLFLRGASLVSEHRTLCTTVDENGPPSIMAVCIPTICCGEHQKRCPLLQYHAPADGQLVKEYSWAQQPQRKINKGVRGGSSKCKCTSVPGLATAGPNQKQNYRPNFDLLFWSEAGRQFSYFLFVC